MAHSATASTVLSEQGWRREAVIERQLALCERNKLRTAYYCRERAG